MGRQQTVAMATYECTQQCIIAIGGEQALIAKGERIGPTVPDLARLYPGR